MRRLVWLAVGACLGLGGCLDMALVSDIAFPATIRGLALDQPWVALPVGSWVNDSAIESKAMAGCFSPGCAPQASVGLFRATGAEAARLAAILDDPDKLVRFLRAGRPARRGVVAKPVPPVTVSAERIREGASRGFALAMAGPDGARPAYGVVLATQQGGALSIILVVAASADGARRIAHEVAAAG